MLIKNSDAYYNVFLREFIYQKYGPLDRDVLCEDLGVTEDDFLFALSKKNNKLSKANLKKVKSFIKKVEKIADNELAFRKLLGRVLFVCSYGKIIDVSDNFFLGKCKMEDGTYSSEIYITDNKISAFSVNNDNLSNIFYKKSKDGSTIKYDERLVKKYEHKGWDNVFFDISTTKTVKTYDKKGRQVSSYSEKIKEDFNRFDDGHIEYTSPSAFDNYVLKNYMHRIGNFIISKEVLEKDEIGSKKSQNKGRTFIGLDDNPDDNEMREPSHLFGIDYKTLELYNNKEISIEEVWKKTRPKYRTMEEFTIY